MNLKEFRWLKGISQKKLADKIGVSQKIISAWEVGSRELPVRHAKKIAEVLDCKWKDLYED